MLRAESLNKPHRDLALRALGFLQVQDRWAAGLPTRGNCRRHQGGRGNVERRLAANRSKAVDGPPPPQWPQNDTHILWPLASGLALGNPSRREPDGAVRLSSRSDLGLLSPQP